MLMESTYHARRRYMNPPLNLQQGFHPRLIYLLTYGADKLKIADSSVTATQCIGLSRLPPSKATQAC